ncbi:MAG: hypothetical protein EBT57_08550 [Verrucomicrobia bacterium]|nr:hypothetical protein [Verrucomicrobiota bacterium]
MWPDETSHLHLPHLPIGSSSGSPSNHPSLSSGPRDNLVNGPISPCQRALPFNPSGMIAHPPSSRLERHFELMEEVKSLETRMAELLREIHENAEELERLSGNGDGTPFQER